MFKSVRYYDGTFDQEKFDSQMLASAEQDGLMSKEDKAKLDEITNTSNEEITVNASNVVQDETHRFVSDEQISAWDAKPETKEALELGNVTNDAQVKRAEMGVAGGVATLDDSGLIPSAQLPGFVDDVVEFDSVDAFPVEGESGKIYIVENKCYRYTGSQYVAIPDSIALGETSSTAYAGDKGKANAEAISSIIAGETIVAKANDATTVSGFAVGANVPANAKFTDTVYEHPETHPATMIVEDEAHRFVTDELIARVGIIPEDAKFTDTLYVHPETHEASMIIQDEAHRFVTDEQIAAWGVDNDTTYEVVTPEVDGLMSATDKAKLDEMYTIPTTPYYDEADNVVYGCGMGITIEAAEEAGKIKIKYADTKGEQEFLAPEGINIYGGGDGVDKPANYPATSITMNSGHVQYLYGGNRRGSVGNAVIVVNGGTFKDGNGGVVAGGHSAGTRESIVGHAEVIINNTDNEATLVFAGGQGLAVVGTTRMIVNGGKIGWLTAGGSHGHTAMAELIVNDGEIKVLQGCNRGTMGNIKTTINGGTIEKVYAGGETEDTSVTATYAKCEMVINGGTIGAISAGTNGGVESAEKVSGTYVADVITDEAAKAMNLVKIDNKIPTTPYYDEADNVVYGCGMGITIEAAEEAGKIKIKYADTEGEKEFTAPEGINIYGGGDGVDYPLHYPASCITMNSGRVKYIYGGCRRGTIGNVVIVVNGGTLDGGVVAGGHSAGTRESIVGHAEVIINNTDNEPGLVYAGGQGLAVVGTTRLTMNGGKIGWLTAGGSNGHTATAELIVNDGSIKVLQGCNRGTVGNIKTTINGGTIGKVYAGGETEDTGVTATYAKCEMVVNGGSIGAISAGTNGGVESAEKVFGTYVPGVITDEAASAMNLTKASIVFTDVVVEGTTLVFKHNDKVVKSIDLSTISA